MEIKNKKTNIIEFEVSDEVLKNIIDAKLIAFNMPPLNTLNNKTIKRLLEIEFFIQYSNELINESLDVIKRNTLTKQNLDKSDIITCSRKTFYNDKILKEYIENCIKNEPDYLNFKQLKKIQDEYNTLKNLYDELLTSIIDNLELKQTIKELEKEVLFITEEKENISNLIMEKDKEIYELKKIIKRNNLRVFPTTE